MLAHKYFTMLDKSPYDDTTIQCGNINYTLLNVTFAHGKTAICILFMMLKKHVGNKDEIIKHFHCS